MRTRARMMMVGAACAALATAVAPAFAQDDAVSPEQAQMAAERRQAIFKLMGWQMGPLGGMLRGQADFDIERVALSAERMSALAPMIPEAFALDTTGADIETEALDGIWTSQEAFHEAAAKLVESTGALKEAAASGDEAATRQAMIAVGQSCGNCHDSFRADDS